MQHHDTGIGKKAVLIRALENVAPRFLTQSYGTNDSVVLRPVARKISLPYVHWMQMKLIQPFNNWWRLLSEEYLDLT